MSQPLESAIVTKIMKAVNAKQGCRLKKYHGSQFGQLELDLYGVVNGRPAFVEVKRPGGKPSPRQAKEIETWASLGAVTGCVTSVDEAFSLLGLN